MPRPPPQLRTSKAEREDESVGLGASSRKAPDTGIFPGSDWGAGTYSQLTLNSEERSVLEQPPPLCEPGWLSTTEATSHKTQPGESEPPQIYLFHSLFTWAWQCWTGTQTLPKKIHLHGCKWRNITSTPDPILKSLKEWKDKKSIHGKKRKHPRNQCLCHLYETDWLLDTRKKKINVISRSSDRGVRWWSCGTRWETPARSNTEPII